MASSSASAAGPQGSDLVLELKTKLYDLCAEEDRTTVFRQEDLLALNVIPDRDIRLLLQITQRLCDEKLFKLVRDGAVAGWMYRPVADAVKYRNLTHEQEMVYTLIDESGAEGIWSKTIKTRSGLHDSTMRAAIKALETRRYITDMKSVEHLNRKMYIKASLTPSEKATGGPWYTDGELDEEFIETIERVLYTYIMAKSFHKAKDVGTTKKPKKPSSSSKTRRTSHSTTTEDAKAARDAALNPRIKLENPTSDRPSKRHKPARDLERLLPLPPGYQGYPTLRELTLFVENGQFTSTTLTHDDISQMLDVLCFDRKIEKVICGPEGLAYKALRKSNREIEDGPINGLTEAPCGRCPVFDLCEEGGPVGPSNCEYFRDWLDT